MDTRKSFTAIILVISFISLHAQNPVQKGIVRTALRPDREIVYLSDVSIRQRGGHNTVLSSGDGSFEMTLPDIRIGSAFYISSVRKAGYELADNATIGKAFTYSPEVPIEIVMLDSRAKQEDIIRITSNAYSRAEKEYAKKMASLEQQLQDKTLSEENYRQQLRELQSGFEKYESLISDMAERYASADYATIDSLNAAINVAIENGSLEQADSLISTVGPLDRLVKESHEVMANVRKKQKIGEAIMEQVSREMTYIEDSNKRLGDLLYSKYSIALSRFETDSAAYYITMRAELDTTNIEWQNEAGSFISEYVADYDMAMALFQRVLRINEEKYGENHPDIATSLNNIGMVYAKQSDYGRAQCYYNKALKIQTELLGESHPDVAASLNNIGIIYTKRGDYDRAHGYYIRALKIQTELLGERHPDVATSLNNIGMVYTKRGDYDAALKYLDRSLMIRTELFGESHPAVAKSFNNIGGIYDILGEYGRAQEYYDRALKIQTELFGESHPDVATSLNNVGMVYIKQGDYDHALEYLCRSLRIQIELFGESHPNVATSYNNIGMVYTKRGGYDRAYGYYNKALKIWIELFGESHPNVATSYNNIGMVYTKQGDYGRAQEYYDKALKVKINLFGKSHPDVATSYNNIGMVYTYQGDYGRAMKYYNKALKIQIDLFGESHPNVAASLNNLGMLYTNQGAYGQALEHLDRSLRIRTGLFGESHPDVATSLNNIGMVYYYKGDYDKAQEYYIKALKIWTEHFGESHPDVAALLNNIGYIGMIYINQEDYDKALEYFIKVLGIEREFCDENDYTILKTYNNIYDCYIKAIKTSGFYIPSYRDFISEMAFIVTVVSEDSSAAGLGMSGEYYLLEYEDWTQCSYINIYEKNMRLRGKPKDILVMKDGIISEHHFEDTIGFTIGLKYVGKEEKALLSEAYDNWKKQHSHEYD